MAAYEPPSRSARLEHVVSFVAFLRLSPGLRVKPAMTV